MSANNPRLRSRIAHGVTHSAISILFTFIGVCAILTYFNSLFLKELLYGVGLFALLPIASFCLVFIIIDMWRIRNNLPAWNIAEGFLRGITQNFVTMAAVIIASMVSACKFHPELITEIYRSLELIYIHAIYPVLGWVIFIIFLIFVFRGKKGGGHK